jgi:hypothetical protein
MSRAPSATFATCVRTAQLGCSLTASHAAAATELLNLALVQRSLSVIVVVLAMIVSSLDGWWLGSGRGLPPSSDPFYLVIAGIHSITDSKKKVGRGRPETGIGPSIGLRLYPDLDAELDVWISAQPDPKPSKPEAIRRLLRHALSEGFRSSDTRG